MIKIFILLLAITSNCWTINPGVFAFLSTHTLEMMKNSAWPSVQDLITKIAIDEEQVVQGIKLSDIKAQITLGAPDVNLHVNPADNTIQAIAKNVAFKGDLHWEYCPMWCNSGTLSFDGHVDNLEAFISFSNQQIKDGMVPKVDFPEYSIDIKDVNASSSGSIISPIINAAAYLFNSMIKDQIEKQVNNNSDIKKTLGTEINKLIIKNYPVAIPVKELDLAISTYMTSDLKVYKTGVLIPLEGFAYNVNTGYKQITDCKEMGDLIDPDTVTNDMYGALGDCTIRSILNTLVESGAEYKQPVKGKTSEIDFYGSLSKWDDGKIEFTKDTQMLGLAAVGKTTIDNQAIQATANNLVKVVIRKKQGLHEVCEYTSNLRFLNVKQTQLLTITNWKNKQKAFEEMFPGVVLSQSIASYDLELKFEKIDNLIITGLPEKFLTSIKNLLMKNDIKTSFDIPQICLADEICLGKLDASINDGFISAIVDLKKKTQNEGKIIKAEQ